jgi:hypothetical protein
MLPLIALTCVLLARGVASQREQLHSAFASGERDPWEVLGLPRGAGAADIKAAFRARAKATHPDKPTGNNEEYVLARAAHDTLLDPSLLLEFEQRRAEQTRWSRRPFEGHPFHGQRQQTWRDIVWGVISEYSGLLFVLIVGGVLALGLAPPDHAEEERRSEPAAGAASERAQPEASVWGEAARRSAPLVMHLHSRVITSLHATPSERWAIVVVPEQDEWRDIWPMLGTRAEGLVRSDIRCGWMTPAEVRRHPVLSSFVKDDSFAVLFMRLSSQAARACVWVGDKGASLREAMGGFDARCDRLVDGSLAMERVNE